MTIMQALEALDREKPNVFTQEDKIGWLNELEAMVTREIVRCYRGGETAEIPVLGDNVEAQLTAPTPYDRMYPLYLAAQADRLNGELGKYNNSITLFMAAYGEYRNWYNRTHESVGASVKYW